MRAALILIVLVFALIFLGMLIFGEIGVLFGVLLSAYLFKGFPAKWEDIEAIIVILGIIGMIVGLIFGFGFSAEKLYGPYY